MINRQVPLYSQLRVNDHLWLTTPEDWRYKVIDVRLSEFDVEITFYLNQTKEIRKEIHSLKGRLGWKVFNTKIYPQRKQAV